jgi:hypothetical protein
LNFYNLFFYISVFVKVQVESESYGVKKTRRNANFTKNYFQILDLRAPTSLVTRLGPGSGQHQMGLEQGFKD